MTPQTITVIQTVAAVIQAIAAAVFLYSVVCDNSRREEERRSALIDRLFQIWNLTPPTGRTPEETLGFHSPRQIRYFDACLKAMGEKWTYSDLYAKTTPLPKPADFPGIIPFT